MAFGFNYTIALSKTSHQYLSPPYGQCNTYKGDSIHPFDASNSIQCYRKCIQWRHKNLLNCVPIFIYNLMNENSFKSLNTNVCNITSFDIRYNISNEMNKFCHNFCPKDCFNVEYKSKAIKSEIHFDNQKWFDFQLPDIVKQRIGRMGANVENNVRFVLRPVERRIIWDSSEPIFAYTDEPVLTFTQFLVNFGGLMGLWFGQSVTDIINTTIKLTQITFVKLKGFLIVKIVNHFTIN